MKAIFTSLAHETPDWGVVCSQTNHSQIVAIAGKHGFSALLYEQLHQANIKLDAPAQIELRRHALALLAAGAHIQRLTESVLGACERMGLPVILLKGFGLAKRLYPNTPHARPSSDVDIVVAPEGLNQAIEVCRSLGLNEQSNRDFDVEHHHHVSMGHKSTLVEIHFQLFSGQGNAGLPLNHFFKRATPSKLSGHAVHFLNEEDELLYLCVHAANHGFLRLFWLLDVAMILKKTSVDLNQVASLAEQGHFHRATAIALHLANTYFDLGKEAHINAAFGTVKRLKALKAVLFTTHHLEAAKLAQHRQGSLLLRLALLEDGFQALDFISQGFRRSLARGT